MARDEENDFGVYKALKPLFRDSKYSDMTIRCGGQDFPAHRAIVCTQSRFFARALDGPFKESKTNTVDLPDDDPETLARFLQFLYAGTYEDEQYPNLTSPDFVSTLDLDQVEAELGETPGVVTMVDHDDGRSSYVTQEALEEPESPEPPEEYSEGSGGSEGSDVEEVADPTKLESNLITSVLVYAMADKYDVPALRLLARNRFYSRARESFRTDSDFPAAVDELYQTTAESDYAMREIPCRLVASGYAEGWEGVVKMEPIMRKYGDFALGVMKYFTMYMEDRDFRAPALVFRAAELAQAET